MDDFPDEAVPSAIADEDGSEFESTDGRNARPHIPQLDQGSRGG